MKTRNRMATALLTLLTLLSIFPVVGQADVSSTASQRTVQQIRNSRYSAYVSKNEAIPFAENSIRLPALSAELLADGKIPQRMTEYKEKQGALIFSEEEQAAVFNVEIPADAQYYLVIEYYPISSKDSPMELRLEVDGELPFYEATALSLPRVWKNETAEIQEDDMGNEFSPRQVEHFSWMEEWLRSSSQDFDEPIRLYLKAGLHQLRLSSVSEPFALGALRLETKPETASYAAYLKKHGEIKKGTHTIPIEAETAARKSSQSLRPLSDRTSPLTTPYAPSKIRMNTIGGENWETMGQWMEWDFTVDKAGYYQPCFRYEQSILEGVAVKRKVTIDGELPYEEMGNIAFPYSYNWNLCAPGGDTPYYVYLTEGPHTLRMEVVLDDFCTVIRRINDLVYDLNNLLRRIHMVVGSESDSQRDKYRDYHIDTEIPDLIPSLQQGADILEDIYGQISEVSRDVASQAAIVRTLQNQLINLINQPETIPYRLDTLSNNVGSLSSWVASVREQPLLLDKIYFVEAGVPLPAYKAGFFEQMAHEVRSFFYSFIEDYNVMSNAEEEDAVTLWIGTGRDQAQIMNRMCRDLFTPKTGIPVNVKLVNASVTEALLSGQAPDVLVMMGRTQPVDLAMRGVLMDLRLFSDFSRVTESFMPGACIPYEFENGCYGLPDSETFLMQFYRKDIFEELGLSTPETWNDFIDCISVIQKNNMDVGAGVIGNAASLQAGSIYSALLYQYGGSFFNEKKTGTALQSEAALEAFIDWTDLYKNYSLPESYDFYNRFRKGEMPLAIASYTEYARLYEAAPEIRDLWEMVPIPGTRNEQGVVEITQAGSGTAAGILAGTENPENAWSFLKWWTGKEAQERYAKDTEAQMGLLARYTTANPEAFASLSWTRTQYANLQRQWESVVDTPELPGGYYLWRGLDNASKEVVYKRANPRESLILWDEQINKEITRKREEFNLHEDG